jgi:hypothetical protein
MTRARHGRVPRRATRSCWTWLARLVAIPLVFVLTSGVAWAYWTAGSLAGGNGASAAAAVNQGATPTASSAGNVVTVSWATSTLSNGTTAVAGYIVKRYDVALTPQTILSACTGTVAATTCLESNVPVGTWTYSVTPVFATSWVGAESAKSSPVTVTPSDAIAPVNAISVSVVSGSAVKSGDTIYYRGSVAGSFTLTNALSDSGSGPASSATAALGGTSTGWTHGPSTESTPSGGPYVSTVFSWTAGATSAPTEVVTGRDVAGNNTTTTLSFVDDSTAPTADTVTYTNGYQAGGSVVVTFTTTGTDSGSGIATRQLQRSFAPLTGGACPAAGSFSGFADVGPGYPTSPYTDSQVTDGSCYRYRYVVTDLVGNQSTATSTNVTKIDSGGGGPALRTAWTYSVLGGTGGVTNGLATSLSGDLGVTPGNSIVGFPPGIVLGSIHAGDAQAAQANADLVLAYTDAATRTKTSDFGGDQNGVTFSPGVHRTGAAFALTGTMTLDGGGDPNALFIFQINAAMNTAASSNVILVNGAQASHIFWQVNGAAGTGALSTLSGTIMANAAITLGAGTQLTGRALAYAAVTLDTNTVSFPTTDLSGPAGGSVDAGGLVGTGSRYSTSTLLSLNPAKGTDPSGVAATGALLSRATATLTSAGTADGVCGTFGSYTLVSGGTDPVSPKSDTVADQACYSYQYVVGDTLGNRTTYTSSSIKVDTTVPTAPTLAYSALTNTYWSGVDPAVVYYRSAAASGTFTTTASATDTASGIASYAFAALGTNWTSTPGTLGVNTYAWSGTPAAPGSKNVTATSNASGTSATASFTPTADDTAPTAGTVTYTGGPTTATSVSVTFTTGTDAGSGVGTGGLLQRASATLTSDVCGTYSAFSTVTNGTNPTSPVVDTVTGGNCYKYQFVTLDNVGNQSAPATSASIAKVSGSAAKLAFTTNPSSSTSGTAFATQPVVAVQDAAGNTTAATNPVTLTITTPAGAVLTCTSNPTNAVLGVATFAGCKIDNAGTYTLTAASGVLSGATSSTFNVTAA